MFVCFPFIGVYPAVTGRNEIWRIAPRGGNAVQVTRNGGTVALESRDGKTLYYAKGRDALWGKALPEGEETQIAAPMFRYNFSVAEDESYTLAAVLEKIKHVAANHQRGLELCRQIGRLEAGKSLRQQSNLNLAGHRKIPFEALFLACDALIEACIFDGYGGLSSQCGESSYMVLVVIVAASALEVEHADGSPFVDQWDTEL